MDEPARAERLHPDLQRDHDSSVYGALVMFGLPGLGAIAWSGWVIATAQSTTRESVGPAIASAFVGSVLLLGWFLVGHRVARWYYRCSEVFYNRHPTAMRVHAIRNDRGGLFLELHSLGDTRMHEARIRIQAQATKWDTSRLDGQVVKVRVDDDPSGPVVVETERGMIWPAPLSRRENRFEGRLV